MLLERFGREFAHWRNDVATHPRQLPRSWRAVDELATAAFELHGESWELRAVGITAQDAELVRVTYVPTARTATHRESSKGAHNDGPVEALEGSAEAAMKDLTHHGNERTVFAGEGGSVTAVAFDLIGLSTDETALDESGGSSLSTRWFESPAARHAFLVQRGMRLSGSQAPDWFAVVGGSGLGAAFEVRWDGQGLTVSRRSCGGEILEDHLTQTDAQWTGMWRKLDLLDAWSWAPSYEPEIIVTDGFSWSADIAFIGRRCRSSGYMAYPGGDGTRATWAAMELALEDIVGLPLYM